MNKHQVGKAFNMIGGGLVGGVVTDVLHHAGLEPLPALMGLAAIFLFVVGSKLQAPAVAK